jgi:TonB family protein
MLESAARSAVALRNYDEARTLLDSSLAIREQTYGPSSASYGAGLLKIGDLERERGNHAEAEMLYQKALNVLQGTPDAATALTDLGILAFSYKNETDADYDQAFGYFERAESADPSKIGTALMWMAVVRDRQGRASEAETLYRTSMAVQDPNSAQAVTTMQLYALFLGRNNRSEESKAIQAQADALHKQQALNADRFAAAEGAAATPNLNALRVGGGVNAPTLVSKVEPQYSEEARAAKLSGTVVLYIEVGTDGRAHNPHVVRSLGLGLDQKAIDAVSQWQFNPGMRNGVPVTVQANVEVNFRLL